ncbi:transcription elongation factor SPT4-like [Sycon ciliatum]|uniref:transcription elongation factor SPT4-like n=1 Tax=Sycon ciliatum TaxID=27933 RepID=UPI0020A9A61C|eukprot:scpid38754/ scgid27932/ Transcription elongation factor SPT4; DRB sensitivity-inducing factor small subunit
MSLDSVPKELRNLRACLLCSMVKTFDQFENDGCDNCEQLLGFRNNAAMIQECTSSSFDGVVSMVSPLDSWVAKWQRIRECVPGIYAISVSGRLPEHIIQELDEGRNVKYIPRDRRQAN